MRARYDRFPVPELDLVCGFSSRTYGTDQLLSFLSFIVVTIAGRHSSALGSDNKPTN